MKPLICLLLAAPAAPAAGVDGHYVLSGVREVGSELLLRPNGRFEYMLAYGAADYSASGAWRRDGDWVVLNTEGKEEPPFRLVKSAPSEDSEIRVWVKGAQGHPVQHIEVVLRTSARSSMQRTGDDGAARFERGAAKPIEVRLRVPVYQLDAGPYKLDPEHNDFFFEINGEAITQVRFKDARLKITGDTLEMRFWGDKTKPMLYRKQ